MLATTLTDRALVRLSGEDVHGFMQGLVTNDVTGTLPVWAGLLTPQGKCLFDFLVWADGGDLLLDCEAAAADDLIKRLTIYRLRRPITIERDLSLAVHWSVEGAEGVPDPRLADLGRRWLQPSTPAKAGVQSEQKESGLLPSQEHKWLEHRLRLGITEGRAELGDVLWLECNAVELNGVSFSKGCFVGQENTARMNWRAKVNRRLVVVESREEGPRLRIAYPGLGLAVEHRRTDDLDGTIIPAWLARSLAQPSTA
ncbi:CAF17-like 4Fe-4S cluster assembly/insertion protein YgfZ [Sphingomonas sp. URHD0057]|uniref:CAF17-like 4Fe-4S cluster assembly/insertion protein YgfZ n=1 Tax=Sphingomonas sp. URHD0057 TaxID=1380389 RepID=UPI00048DFAF9|nr:folate-binding protein YgfZ [Sphingomonas sp. URHD0057]